MTELRVSVVGFSSHRGGLLLSSYEFSFTSFLDLMMFSIKVKEKRLGKDIQRNLSDHSTTDPILSDWSWLPPSGLEYNLKPTLVLPLGILNLLSFLYQRQPLSLLEILTGNSLLGQSSGLSSKSVAVVGSRQGSKLTVSRGPLQQINKNHKYKI